jgi:uracil phosphoribosyltransferase
MSIQMRVIVPPHPLVQHWLGVVRDASTPTTLFRAAMTELGRWLTYEAIRDEGSGKWLATINTTVETPLAPCAASFVDPNIPVAIVPILRAGLAFMDGAQPLLPLASIYHLGLVRNEETLESSCYVNKLPAQIDPQTRILIPEPMLATGGSSMTAMEELVKRGADPSLIRIISVVVAPPALQKLSTAYPGLKIFCACVDEGLNEHGFIVPGLGDAGDRTFGT